MSDLRARELERRWLESRTQLDQAAWLSQLLRIGRIDPASVELAAQLGEPTAGLVLGKRPAPTRELIGLVATGGWVLCARAAHALAAAALGRAAPSTPVEALSALERWVEAEAHPRVPADTFRVDHADPTLGKRTRKRVGQALAALRHACIIPVEGPRIARVALEATWREAAQILPAREPPRVVAKAVGRWLLLGQRSEEPAESVSQLLVVARRVAHAHETRVHPGVDLGRTGELRFRVEVRQPGHAVGKRCVARAVPRWNDEWRHTLFLPLSEAQVQVGSAIWEVGP